MHVKDYAEAMKNLPARFSNLTFWRECRKLKNSVVDALTYLNDWGIGVENGLNNKLPKSPTEWENWTSDEQDTARVKLGAEKALGDWEDIATVTIEEAATSVIVDKDNNGNPFSLSHVALECVIPKEEIATTRHVWFANSKTASESDVFSRITSRTNTDYPIIVSTCAHILSGRILCESSIVSIFNTSYNQNQVYAIPNGYCHIIAESFESISLFTYSDAFPVGSKFIVRGIRK